MPEPAYPAYVVNESEYETEPVRVVTVNKPNSSVDQMEELLNRLLAVLTPAVPTPAKTTETSPMDKLVQLSETAKRKPVPPVPAEPAGLEMMLRTYFGGTAVATTTAPISTGTTKLARNEVFLMWENGSRHEPLPNIGCDFPIYITGLEG